MSVIQITWYLRAPLIILLLLQAGPVCAGPGMGQDEFPDPGRVQETQEARHQASVTNVSDQHPPSGYSSLLRSLRCIIFVEADGIFICMLQF